MTLYLQGGLGKALDNTANDFMKATADVSREFVTSNPLVNGIFDVVCSTYV